MPRVEPAIRAAGRSTRDAERAILAARGGRPLRDGAAMAVSLDTLRIVKRLKEAGLEERQAEAITDVLRESRELDLSALAGKADLQALKSEVERRFVELGAEMDRRFAELEGKMERRFAELSAETDRRFGALDTRMSVLQAKLGMLEWMIGGIGFGLLLLIVRSFWPGAP